MLFTSLLFTNFYMREDFPFCGGDSHVASPAWEVMPSKPKKPCAQPMCPELTAEKYCEKHKDKRTQDNRYYDQHIRDKQATAFYHSVEWQRVREQALIRDHYLCQGCLLERRITPADVVDHIKPIKWFWNLRLVLNNLRSLCHPHHNKKTAEDKKKYGGKGSVS